jgi:hypothetical protein
MKKLVLYTIFATVICRASSKESQEIITVSIKAKGKSTIAECDKKKLAIDNQVMSMRNLSLRDYYLLSDAIVNAQRKYGLKPTAYGQPNIKSYLEVKTHWQICKDKNGFEYLKQTN